MSTGSRIFLTSSRWKVAFVEALQRLRDEAYVQARLDALKPALQALANHGFVRNQREAFGRGGDEAGARLTLSDHMALSRGRSVMVDRTWSLDHVEDRNERWMLQQWIFLRDGIGRWQRDGDASVLAHAVPWLVAWAEVNAAEAALERENDMSWHDHVTALRAINVIWLASLLATALPPTEELLRLVVTLVEVHSAVLSADDFYSVGTNHGFDQAYALYFLTAALPISDAVREAKGVARSRLVYELNFAFNEEGVHVENSPSYHATMLMRLLRAQALLRAFDHAQLAGVAPVVEKGMMFLTHALKPNGCLPLLGDTEALPLRLELDALKEFHGYAHLSYAYSGGKEGVEPPSTSACYPKAGYAFLRDRWSSPGDDDSWHVALKCGFLSTYHRHDDDNTLLLFAFGEDWLIGSGIYKYHEQDPLRKYLRSPEAQNILTVGGALADRNVKEARSAIDSFSTKDGVTSLRASSNMNPGFVYERRLVYDRGAATINLLDVMEPATGGRNDFVLRFHVPRDRKISVLSPSAVRVTSERSGRSMLLEIQSEAPDIVDVVSGQAEPPLGWTSPQRGVIEPAQSICFKSRAEGRFEMASRITFGEAATGTR